jgi:hypothetical protein
MTNLAESSREGSGSKGPVFPMMMMMMMMMISNKVSLGTLPRSPLNRCTFFNSLLNDKCGV